jgi:hypothetical protein
MIALISHISLLEPGSIITNKTYECETLLCSQSQASLSLQRDDAACQ